MIGEKKRKFVIVTKWMPTKKTVNEFEWMDLMAKKLQPDKRMFE